MENEEIKKMQKSDRELLTIFFVIATAVILFVIAVFVREGAFQ